jgi:hypothetical protein
MAKIIGKVSATEKCPATTEDFYFWTDKGCILSPFDIVKVEQERLFELAVKNFYSNYFSQKDIVV